MKPKQKRAIDKKSVFLAAFRVCASITEAAKATKINRSLHYRWLKEDVDYPARFAAARLVATQAAEGLALLTALRVENDHEQRIAKLEAAIKLLKG